MGETLPELSETIKELADQCNDKHVKVVEAIVSGKYSSNTAAYMEYYPKASPDSAKESVCKILTIPNVKKLHAALKDEKLLEGIITRSEAMKLLSDMATTSMSDLVEFRTVEIAKDDTGEPVMQSVWTFKDGVDLSPEQLRSISELTATRDGLKIKQHDQKAALKQLADMQGWEAPKKIKHSGTLKTINQEMSLEEATEVYRDNLKALKND